MVGQTIDGRLSEGSAAGDRYEFSGTAGSRVVTILRKFGVRLDCSGQKVSKSTAVLRSRRFSSRENTLRPD